MGGLKKLSFKFFVGLWCNFIEEGLDVFFNLIVVYVIVKDLDFYFKIIYIVMMVWCILMVVYNFELVDDCDFVGNKCLELVGQLLFLLFEDLFKGFIG